LYLRNLFAPRAFEGIFVTTLFQTGEFKVNLQINCLWSQYHEFGGSPRPHVTSDRLADAWFLRPPAAHAISPPVVISETSPALPPRQQDVLSPKIREAMSPDPDPEKSLAQIRAILVGPAQRLHEARVEEIIDILEESDQAAQLSLTKLQKRCTELAATCEKLGAALEKMFQQSVEQSTHFESELKIADHKQKERLDEIFQVIDSRFFHVKDEVSGQIEALVAQAARNLELLSTELAARMLERMRIQDANFQKLTEQFETRFFMRHEGLEKEQKRNAELFARGFSDIAERLMVLRGEQAN
jgi:hypothetical protein